MPKHHGSCHCGNVQVEYDTSLSFPDWPLRACQCAFCRAHGVTTTSDPKGRLSVNVKGADKLSVYRFGMRVTDFLICKTCGVYLAAVTESEGEKYAVLVVNNLDCREQLLDREPQAMVYDAEQKEQRVNRRAERW